MNTPKHFAFVSYSTPSLVWAMRVQAGLAVLGLQSYVAEQSWKVGEERSVIENAVRSASMVVIVWDGSAAASDWVKHEIGVAHGAQVPTVFLVVEAGIPIPVPVQGPKYADAVRDPFAAINAIQAAAVARVRQIIAARDAAATRFREEMMRAQEADSKRGLGLLILGGLAMAALAGKD